MDPYAFWAVALPAFVLVLALVTAIFERIFK